MSVRILYAHLLAGIMILAFLLTMPFTFLADHLDEECFAKRIFFNPLADFATWLFNGLLSFVEQVSPKRNSEDAAP